MNKVYDISGRVNSNNGIYEAFYAEIVAPTKRYEGVVEHSIERIEKLIKSLTGATAKRLSCVAGFSFALIGIIGIAGGIQHESISLLGGLGITLALLGVEFLCLKKCNKK